MTLEELVACDALPINLLLQEIWGESIFFDVFFNHISSQNHHVLIAEDTCEVVGFLSAFLVPSLVPRWEIDLVVVHPKSQRRGVGTTLIQEGLTYGTYLGVYCAKASIRVDNYASQRAFSNAGFILDDQVHSLLTWDPLACGHNVQTISDVCLIPIETLIYRGLWIEGFVESQLTVKEQHTVIRAAQNRIYHENRLNTGMFVRDSSMQLIAPDLLTSSTNCGQFHNWQYIFK